MQHHPPARGPPREEMLLAADRWCCALLGHTTWVAGSHVGGGRLCARGTRALLRHHGASRGNLLAKEEASLASFASAPRHPTVLASTTQPAPPRAMHDDFAGGQW